MIWYDEESSCCQISLFNFLNYCRNYIYRKHMPSIKYREKQYYLETVHLVRILNNIPRSCITLILWLTVSYSCAFKLSYCIKVWNIISKNIKVLLCLFVKNLLVYSAIFLILDYFSIPIFWSQIKHLIFLNISMAFF